MICEMKYGITCMNYKTCKNQLIGYSSAKELDDSIESEGWERRGEQVICPQCLLAEKMRNDKDVIEKLYAQIEQLQNAFLSMEIHIVDGYFVRIWREGDSWLAFCSAARALLEFDSRQKALDGIAEDIPEMISAIVKLGEARPKADVVTYNSHVDAHIKLEEENRKIRLIEEELLNAFKNGAIMVEREINGHSIYISRRRFLGCYRSFIYYCCVDSRATEMGTLADAISYVAELVV